MKVHLENSDLHQIASLISVNGSGNVYYDEKGINICIECKTLTSGYMEDDYSAGTGSYIPTYAECEIYDVYVEDSEVEVVYDREKLIHITEELLLN